jgi:GWxTD domain-containing protein
LTSCYSSRSGRKSRDRERSYNKPYHQEDTDLKLSMFLLHTNDSVSYVYYRIDNSQLLYKKSDSTNYYWAKIKFFYKVLPYPEASALLDSATVNVLDKSEGAPPGKILSGNFSIPVKNGQDSYIEFLVEDVFSKKKHKHYVESDKKSVFSQQNFLLSSSSGQVFFTNKISKGSSVTLTNYRKRFSKAKIEYYKVDYSLPPPPFSSKEPQLYPAIPDSGFASMVTDNNSFSVYIGRQGIYHIRPDSINAGGALILGVEPNFPKVQSHEQMIAASRFIMNKEEYQKLIDAGDKQSAIEAFWLSIAGNSERAKELIKRYYNRVQDANTFFTSHIEGWKTDMGMIYIIFGTPGKTYKTSDMETWEYYIQNGAPPLTFRFEKIKNPFSENCYKLQRSINFKDPWTLAVSYWREGRVYLED